MEGCSIPAIELSVQHIPILMIDTKKLFSDHYITQSEVIWLSLHGKWHNVTGHVGSFEVDHIIDFWLAARGVGGRAGVVSRACRGRWTERGWSCRVESAGRTVGSSVNHR